MKPLGSPRRAQAQVCSTRGPRRRKLGISKLGALACCAPMRSLRGANRRASAGKTSVVLSGFCGNRLPRCSAVRASASAARRSTCLVTHSSIRSARASISFARLCQCAESSWDITERSRKRRLRVVCGCVWISFFCVKRRAVAVRGRSSNGEPCSHRGCEGYRSSRACSPLDHSMILSPLSRSGF